MIRVVGETTDGKPVVAGLYHFFETHGLPLDMLAAYCADNGLVPCWLSLVRECIKAGISEDRAIIRVKQAVSDGWPTDVKLIQETLDIYYQHPSVLQKWINYEILKT